MIGHLFDNDPRQVGPYRLLGRLGAGGMGVVYLASSPAEDVVAVKLIRADLAEDAAFRARFSREVDAARRVGGVCTARVRDADLEGDRPWVVTDFVTGPNLGELVARHGPLPADQQRALAIGLAEALDAVHRAGVVHRDLKPTNVLCSPAGPRLIDFGIAHAADRTSATLTGQLVGSPAWMAPEHIQGRAATPAIDMFAFGSVLVFAATGRPPFGTGRMVTVMYRILNEAPDLGPPGALAPQLVPIVAALLAKEPASRPGPGGILTELAGPTTDPVHAVTGFLDRTWVLPADEPDAVPAAVERSASAPLPTRRRWKTAAAATAAAAAAAVLVVVLLLATAKGHKPQADPTTTATSHPAATATTDPPTTPASTALPTTAPPTTTPPTTTPPSTIASPAPPATAPATTAPPAHGNADHGNAGKGNTDQGNAGQGNAGHGNGGHGTPDPTATTPTTQVPAAVVAECQADGGQPRPDDDPPECLQVPYVGTDGSRYYIEVGMSATGLIPPDLTGAFAANQSECVSGQYPMANPGKNTAGAWDPALGICKPTIQS